ncbi:MAG TPA: hypothetical protein GX715_14360, partial [Armatimonadetes bacterium]|nr:hypothetical protein [Armatimonadota bacterium]
MASRRCFLCIRASLISLVLLAALPLPGIARAEAAGHAGMRPNRIAQAARPTRDPFSIAQRTAPGGESSLAINEEAVVQGLQRENVLVDEGITRLTAGDERALEAFAADGRPRLKILVLAVEPTGGRASFTLNLHRYLSLGETALVVVTPEGVSAHSEAISRERMQRLTDEAAPQFALSWRQGIEHLGNGIRAEVRARSVRTRAVILALALVVALLLSWRAYRRRRELERLLAEARGRAADLAQALHEAETDVRLSEDPRVKEYYAQASQRFVETSAALEKAVTLADARHALALAQEAERLLQCARNPTAAPDDPPGDPAGAEEMPACFFCSRPASEGVLEPSTLDVQGRRRRVLACRACTEELRQGRMPRVRVVHDGGNEVPWFRSSTYDPRRDWTRR